MKTSYKKSFEFEAMANQFLSKNSNDTKLKTALEDVLVQLPEIHSAHEKYCTRIRRKYAAEDKHGCILREENGGYKFTKANEEKADDELTELLENPDLVEIDPVIVEIPKDFPRVLLRYFKGFVFES